MRVKIKFISVLMRLVSIRGGSLNSSWYPRQVLGESKVLALIINIKYNEDKCNNKDNDDDDNDNDNDW